MLPRLGRRKGRAFVLFVLSITATVVYIISAKDAARKHARDLREVIRPAESGEPTTKMGKGVCKASPYYNITAEYDMFKVYRDYVAHGEEGKPDISRKSNSDKLKVFVVPFTHVDPGWLETFEAYTKNTDSILDNMHRFMTGNPNMTFIWAELAFLEKWWIKQNSTIKNDVRRLVQSGRLEIASGSWVMTDEANVYYPLSVDNIIEGHEFLRQELGGVRPKVVWSNDPFGYSNSVPYLFTQAGMKRTIINRVHHGIKGYLQGKKAVPFLWRQYFDPKGDSDMLTHLLPYTHYDILNSCGPNQAICCEFDFRRMTEWSCPGPKPVPITSGNVAERAHQLMSQLKEMSQLYESNVLLMVHGDDFRYGIEQEWHQQHDNFLPLFNEINTKGLAEIRFGTFSNYFDALEKWYAENGKKPATLSGDFFPYKCALGDMWTGYYTTRPFTKRQERSTHNIVRAADLMVAEAMLKMNATLVNDLNSRLREARQILSLFQHHDAITGTSRRHVMKDYSKLLHHASSLARSSFEEAAGALAGTKVHVLEYALNQTETETLATIKVADSGTWILNVFNSLPYTIEDVVSLRVDSPRVAVNNERGGIEAQIEPHIHKGQVSGETFLLSFRCILRALSTSSFVLKAEENPTLTTLSSVYTSDNSSWVSDIPSVFDVKEIEGENFFLKNELLKTSHDKETGQLTHVKKTAATKVSLSTSFHTYQNAMGGAYLMKVDESPELALRTYGNAVLEASTGMIGVLYEQLRSIFILHTTVSPEKLTSIFSDKTSIDSLISGRFKQIHGGGSPPRLLTRGPIQETMHLFYPDIYQRFTVKNVKGSLGQQVNMLLRVDISGAENTELLLRVETDLEQPRFYADSAGLQLLRRKRYDELINPANFYPMPSAAVLEDDQRRITVTSNVPHGVSPSSRGMDIILDRILNQDDGKGLGSGPDSLPIDLLPVEMRFAFLVENIDKAEKHEYSTYHTSAGHLSVHSVLYPPVVAIGAAAVPSLQAHADLPCNLHLLTVRAVANGRRLLTIYNSGSVCHTNTDTMCTGDLKKGLTSYLQTLGVVKVQETDLAGSPISKEVPLDRYSPFVQPYKFLSLLLSFSK